MSLAMLFSVSESIPVDSIIIIMLDTENFPWHNTESKVVKEFCYCCKTCLLLCESLLNVKLPSALERASLTLLLATSCCYGLCKVRMWCFQSFLPSISSFG